MAEILHIRYPQYCFRSELQIILDNVTILRCYFCCLNHHNYLKIMGHGSSSPKFLLQQAWVRLGKLINLDGLGNYTLMALSLQ